MLAMMRTEQNPGSDYYRFEHMSIEQINEFFEKSQKELSNTITLDLLSAAEGRLRDDFEKRAQDDTRTDSVSKDFKVIAKYCIRDRKRNPLNLRTMLDVWSIHHPNNTGSINRFLKYWPLRNWLAHGRWTPQPSFEGPALPPPDDVKDAIETLLANLGIPTS
ncbi:MAG: hypothetical protein HQM03_21300 [Magnetococcales bacterium]|nr:hypothetical protein [Magnetococcales bacterium]